MRRYILKVGQFYIASKTRFMGLPELTKELGGALILPREEALSFMETLCCKPELIEI